MNISDVTGASYVAPTQPTKPLRESPDERLQSLVNAIESGDLDDVEQSYSTVKESLPETTESSNDPVSQFLAAVENGLASRDTEELQTAATEFAEATQPSEADAPKFQPSSPPPVLDEESADSLNSLLSALDSDDVDSAQSSLESLSSSLSTNVNSEDSDTSSLQAALDDISKALEAGDTDTAANTLQEALKGLPNGTILVVEA